MTRRAWREGRPTRCEVCGASGYLEAHHVLRAQWVRRHGGDPYDPRDRIVLCPSCHPDGARSAGRKLAIAHVRDETITFAVETAGPGPAFNEFKRWIEGHDGRLDELIEQASPLA